MCSVVYRSPVNRQGIVSTLFPDYKLEVEAVYGLPISRSSAMPKRHPSLDQFLVVACLLIEAAGAYLPR